MLGGYLIVVILANIVQGFIILSIFLSMRKIQSFMALCSMLPALSVAFFSKSSTGSLPVTMQTAENNLNVSPKISRFVLSLCTSVNMNGCAAFIFTTIIYIMQNNGIDN
ncbi:MAG: cation:dicarboxylase symporter family transporter [Rickettsiales endosymbiont of Dermacentor nuttalli]